MMMMIVFQRIKLITLFLRRCHFKQKAFGYKAFSFLFFTAISSSEAASNSLIPNVGVQSVWTVITAIVRVRSWIWFEHNSMNVHTQMGMSKGGGKQWKITTKNLLRMQCARSHTGHMTGLWFLPTRPLRLNTNEWMNTHKMGTIRGSLLIDFC